MVAIYWGMTLLLTGDIRYMKIRIQKLIRINKVHRPTLPFSTSTPWSCGSLSLQTQAVLFTDRHGLKQPMVGMIIKATTPFDYVEASELVHVSSYLCLACLD